MCARLYSAAASEGYKGQCKATSNMKIALSVVLFLTLTTLDGRNASSQEIRPSIDPTQNATADQKIDMKTVISLLQIFHLTR